MTPIKPLEDELTETLGEWSWPTFEATDDGHIRLDENPKHYAYDFYMRVGLHMQRPTQVIISCGKFIKMRKEDRWDEKTHQLVKIDPVHPEICLYPENYLQTAYLSAQNVYQPNQYGQNISPTPKLGWKPQLPNYNYGIAGAAMSTPIIWATNTTTNTTNVMPNNYTGCGGWAGQAQAVGNLYAQQNLSQGLANSPSFLGLLGSLLGMK